MVSAFLKGWNWRKKAAVDGAAIDRDCLLRVFLNDITCELAVSDREGLSVAQVVRESPTEQRPAEALLNLAMQQLPPGICERVGDVQIFLDDPEMSVMDSRQAKLSHFEGRALAEFGKYQLGGKPVCFASHRFGETSAQETEKRVVAYISEDRLTAVLFALGKLARFATFFGPWSLQSMLARGDGDETITKLAIHGNYSTLTVASPMAGAIAVRTLPVGGTTLIAAYATENGITLDDARSALQARSRLSMSANSSETVVTGSQLALQPIVDALGGEVAATADYFEFQRLAGRAGALQISTVGTRISGLTNWLSKMLSIEVQLAGSADFAKPYLNLLEGMRAGILKLGNQTYDFVGGRFLISAASQAQASAGESMMTKLQKVSKQPISLATLQPIAKPLGISVALIALLVGAHQFLLAPVGTQLSSAAEAYENSLGQHQGRPASPVQVKATEPTLWAKDLISVAGALPYDITVERIALLSGGTGGATLQITGSASTGRDSLQLVSRFITRIGASAPLKRRFSEVTFGGIGQGTDKDPGDSQFRIFAKVIESGVP